MKKKIFGTILAAALVVAQAVTVFAAGSRVAEAAPAGESTGRYEFTAITEDTFQDLAESVPDVKTLIDAINAGTETIQALAEQASDLTDTLADKEMLTPIFDLQPIDGGIQTEDGNYLVTMSVPTLTEEMSDVLLLHYSTVRSVWEIITPMDVDYANKEITAEFEDLSPVAVIAKVNGSAAADTQVGTSPKTGVVSDWMGWLGAAVVLGAVSVAAVRKSRQ
ncbi:MAG TPA: cell wall protein [Candidatus Mediterraneibacter intestinavium]|nr:cell wall protein [Candidatus Mediterraneibacter intestinavium]